jgi:hypothetical protein
MRTYARNPELIVVAFMSTLQNILKVIKAPVLIIRYHLMRCDNLNQRNKGEQFSSTLSSKTV